MIWDGLPGANRSPRLNTCRDRLRTATAPFSICLTLADRSALLFKVLQHGLRRIKSLAFTETPKLHPALLPPNKFVCHNTLQLSVEGQHFRSCRQRRCNHNGIRQLHSMCSAQSNRRVLDR